MSNRCPLFCPQAVGDECCAHCLSECSVDWSGDVTSAADDFAMSDELALVAQVVARTGPMARQKRMAGLAAIAALQQGRERRV